MQHLAINSKQTTTGTDGLLPSLAVLLPSFLTLLWAIGLSSSQYPNSSFWFLYVIGRDFSYVGILIVAIRMVSGHLCRKLAHSASVMVSSSIFLAILFLWFASLAVPFGY